MSAVQESNGAGGLLEAKYNIAADAKMLRGLLKSPIYVPNETFKKAAVTMQAIAGNDEYDVRARVAAQKAVIDIMKLNLAVHESQKPQGAAQQHLHLHQHEAGHEPITTDELVKLVATLGTSQVIDACSQLAAVESAKPTPVESMAQ